MKKKLIIPMIIILSVAVVAIIYISYGFVSARITKNELATKEKFTNQSLKIEYSDGKETLTSNNTSFIPGSTITKEFTITNIEDPTTYTIKIGDCLPDDESECIFENTFKRPADITYEMYLNNEIIEKTTFPIYKDEPLASNITIDKDETQNLKLLIYYNNSTDNQIVDSGSKIGGKLTFEDEKNIIENVLIYGNTVTNDDSTTTSLGENGTITLTTNRNLVKNGFGEYGDNTNFPSNKLYYNKSEKTNTSRGSLSIIQSKNDIFQATSTNIIPVDTNKVYEQSINVKNPGDASKSYVGFSSYDIDKKGILSHHVLYMIGSTTTLKEDLNPGDLEIHVESTAGFELNENNISQKNGLIFWNYKDNTGYQYQIETYSRNVYTSLYNYDNVSETTITLNESWSGDYIPKGTSLSQSNISGSYTYSLCNGCKYTNQDEWLKQERTIKNVLNYTQDLDSIDKFRNGTKYVNFFVGTSYDYEGDNINLLLSDIYIGRNDMAIENTINLSSPLSCFDGICDYIDIKNKRVVRKVSNGSILSTPTYEEIDVPDLSLFTSKMITVSDGTLEASDIKVEYK